MRNRNHLYSSVLLALTLIGCASTHAPVELTKALATSVDADRGVPVQLNALYEQFWEESLRLNPLMATQQGDGRYNGVLPNTLGAEYRAQNLALDARYLANAKAIVGSTTLSGQDALSFEIFIRGRENDLAQAKFPRHLIPLNQFYSFANQFVVLGSGSNAQPFKTVADYDNWLKRAANIPVNFDQAIANMREGITEGYVQPIVLMQRTLPQLAQQLVDKPEESLFYGPIKAMPADFSDADKARLTKAYRALISDTLLPSYRKLHDFVKEEYLPKCRSSSGLGAMPDGVAWYAQLVRDNTTTDLTPDQIHQIGLDEVARIHGEIRKVMQTMNFKGDLQAFFKSVQEDPKQSFASEADLLRAYRAFRAELEPKLGALFDLRPKGDFEIRPVEAFRAASSSSGSYQRAPQDRSRPGIFYVNTFDLRARPIRALESLYLHEATPGHHFQIALQQESEQLPKFRRFGGETAFAEGWGLYSESLGKELGVYRDPMMYFGALEADLWRAIRLVADTGLHAKGWSREQVLAYMYENSATEATRAQSETERFMAIPGQALAYKIGQLKIRELRTRAENTLGSKFNIRQFHNEILRDGALPLDVLENKMDAWVRKTKA
jgi:uncharacterized protein (DUF885 family)